LQLVAMLSIGALRISLEAFNRQERKRPITVLLAETLNALEAEV
jgi:hypothetical protein